MKGFYPRVPWGHNAGSEQPGRMVIYNVSSVETEQPQKRSRTLHTLRCGVARFLRRKDDDWNLIREGIFRSPAEFWLWLEPHLHRREPLWVYAYNQSLCWTLVDGWGELAAGRLSMRHTGDAYTDRATGQLRKPHARTGNLVCDSIPFVVDCWRNRCRVKAVDFLNYANVPLAQLAQWCGNARLVRPANDATTEDHLHHCRHDLNVIQEATLKLMGVWRGRKLGTWKTTVAGLAYSSFRHTAPANGIVAHGDEPLPKGTTAPIDKWGSGHVLDAREVSCVERRAYAGGRVFLGFVGEVEPSGRQYQSSVMGRYHRGNAVETGPLAVVDVNGLYPYVMRTFRYPVELMTTIRHPGIQVSKTMCESFECIADVTVNTNADQYPLRQSGRVVYPVGTYRTSLAGVELRNALVRGHVSAIENLCVYHVGKPFTDFVDYWWVLRASAKAAGDVVTAKVCKAIIVSLFGKLGQREPTWKDVFDVPPLRPFGGFVHDRGDGRGMRRYRAIARHVQEMSERRDCKHTFTAAAACITAHGRNLMDQLRKLCPLRSVVYQDTDSLFVLPPGLEALQDARQLHPTEIGRLKLEGHYELASIIAPKLYQLDGRLVASGLKAGSVPLDRDVYESVQFQQCGSIVIREPGGAVESWKTIWRTPQLAAPVVVNADGWTSPITVS